MSETETTQTSNGSNSVGLGALLVLAGAIVVLVALIQLWDDVGETGQYGLLFDLGLGAAIVGALLHIAGKLNRP